MINCYRKQNHKEKFSADSDAMKALEAYIYWSQSGSVLEPGKF
jgi:thiosulfate dehydrogenase